MLKTLSRTPNPEKTRIAKWTNHQVSPLQEETMLLKQNLKRFPSQKMTGQAPKKVYTCTWRIIGRSKIIRLSDNMLLLASHCSVPRTSTHALYRLNGWKELDKPRSLPKIKHHGIFMTRGKIIYKRTSHYHYHGRGKPYSQLSHNIWNTVQLKWNTITYAYRHPQRGMK